MAEALGDVLLGPVAVLSPATDDFAEAFLPGLMALAGQRQLVDGDLSGLLWKPFSQLTDKLLILDCRESPGFRSSHTNRVSD
jgi:hypothetical protein